MLRQSLVFILTIFFLSSSANGQAGNRENPIDTTLNDETSRFGKFVDDIIDRIEREFIWHFGYEEYQEEDPDTSSMHITFDSRRGAIHFNGDVVIDERDRIDGDIVVRNGSITVRGQIDGDILVLNGDAIIANGGKVDGSVTTVNGRVVNLGGEITGEIDEQEGVDVDIVYKERKPAQRRPYRLSYSMQEDITVRDLQLSPFRIGFNRVEGLSIGLGSRKHLYWDGSMALALYGQVGYAFKAHRWRAQLGATRQFTAGTNNLFELGGEIYTLTDTKDEWIIDKTENDLAAFFLKRDYRDYYDREGFSFYAGHYLNTAALSAHLRVQYLNELHSSMRNRTDWALFGRDRSFRLNPDIDEGRLNAIRVALNLSSVQPSPQRISGWRVLTAMEYTSPSLNSDLDYTQYIIDVRRYQPVSSYDSFNVRLRAGTSEGDVPMQRIYELGGLGTLPAFPHKIFAGNRMLLMNAEYVIRGDVLSQLAFIPRNMFGGLSLLLFVDSGWVGNVDNSIGIFSGFDDFSLNNMKTSIGFGFGSRDGNARLGFAWRTDHSESAVIFFRIMRPF